MGILYVAALAVVLKRCRWGGRLMGSKGSDFTKRRARESDPAKVGGDGNIMVAAAPLSSASFCRHFTVGIIWWKKKRFLPGRVGNIPGEAGKKSIRKRWTIDGGTVVSQWSTGLTVLLEKLWATFLFVSLSSVFLRLISIGGIN
jgi:hypothetical protein